ncbi:armadillo-type protein [Russula earlei]|uniref:Armadillo-type protein n=1 Tax=Russula earlei TaxID=71964 RepID=A0ACC0UJM7_9AGAM|nr:armadillo-type protein [Russula earlei]
MPKEIRKRGKKHKKPVTPVLGQQSQDNVPSTKPSWILSSADSNSKTYNPEAPFGYVDPELKAYFRTVDDQLKEWQQNRGEAEAEEDVDPNENRRMFLMAALQEISGKERQLATDPDCAGGLERMAYSMDDFVRRVFVDSLTGSYELLIKHRFASHVVQTLLTVAPDTIARESRGVAPTVEDSDKGQLRTLTQLILDFSEEILPSLPVLIMDQFASHVVRALFLLLCPHLFKSDAPHKSQSFVRSRKSVAWKARQDPLKSIFGSMRNKGQTGEESAPPPAFHEFSRRCVTTLRTTLDANEVRSLAANKAACPVLQMAIEMEADQGLSDEPGSLMDYVLVGLISASHNDPSVMPEASDYLATLLRDPTSSHLLETIISRCPETVFRILWLTYFERSLKKLAMHPVANFVIAKAVERADAEQLSYALYELQDSFGKLRQTRIGVLRAFIERTASLGILEKEICEAICSAFQVGTEEDQMSFVLCALSLKSTTEYAAAVRENAAALANPKSQVEVYEKRSQKSRDGTLPGPLEPTTTGALLLQSLLRLHAPHNALVLNSIESLSSQELLALAHHPAASRVLDAIIDGTTIPPRSRRTLLRAMEAQFADVIDDRIGARVGARCWAAADPYLKEKLAQALLPHAARLAGSSYARFFTRGLALSLLQRKPEEWRRLHATPSSSGTTAASTNTARSNATVPSAVVAPIVEEDEPEGEKAGESSSGKKRKKRRRNAASDEIDALFEDMMGRKVVRSALKAGPVPVPLESKTKAREGGQGNEAADLNDVEIKAAPGKKRSKRRRGPS